MTREQFNEKYGCNITPEQFDQLKWSMKISYDIYNADLTGGPICE